MAFKLKFSDNFTVPVTVEIPDDTKTLKQTFDAKFRRVTRTEFNEMLSAASKKNTDLKILQDVLLDWSGIKDAEGNDFEFNEKNKEALFEIYQVIPSLIRAFFSAMAAEKEKN